MQKIMTSSSLPVFVRENTLLHRRSGYKSADYELEKDVQIQVYGAEW